MNAVNPVHSPGVPNAAEPSMEEILASIRRIIADDTSLRPVEGADPTPSHAVSHVEVPAAPEAQGDMTAPPQAVAEPAAPVPHPPELALPEPELPQHEEPASARAAHETSAADELREGHGGNDAPQFPSPEGPMAEPIAELPRHPLAPPEVADHRSVEIEPAPPPPLSHDEELAQADPTPAAEPPHHEPLFSAVTDSSVTSAFNMLAASRLVDNSEQLAGLVQEMIRPLVKAWVDEHLPGLVERLVVAEIERMARR